MKSTSISFLKMTFYAFIISILISIPLFATWASSLSEDDIKLWKMWIKLAIDGYADPMPMPRPKAISVLELLG